MKFIRTLLFFAFFSSYISQSATFKTFSPSYPIKSIAFSPDGKSLLLGGNNGEANLWDATTSLHEGTFKLKDSTLSPVENVNLVQFSPDGSKIVTSSLEEPIKLWDTKTKKLLHQFKEKGRTSVNNPIFFSPDSQKIFLINRVYDIAKRKYIASLNSKFLSVNSTLFSPDSQNLIYASMATGLHIKKLGKWDPFPKRKMIFNHYIKAIAISPDGKKILSIDAKQGKAEILDYNTLKVLIKIELLEKNTERAFFTADGMKIISLHDKKNIKIWNSNTGALEFTIKNLLISPSIALSTSDSKHLIIRAPKKRISIWNLDTKKEVLSLKGSFSKNLALSSCNTKIAVAMNSGKVRIYDISKIKAKTNQKKTIKTKKKTASPTKKKKARTFLHKK